MRLILRGLMFTWGGLSGLMVLRGTNSSKALAVVGIVMLILGLVHWFSDDSSTDERSVFIKESTKQPGEEPVRPVKTAVLSGMAAAPAISSEELERQMRLSRDPTPRR